MVACGRHTSSRVTGPRRRSMVPTSTASLSSNHTTVATTADDLHCWQGQRPRAALGVVGPPPLRAMTGAAVLVVHTFATPDTSSQIRCLLWRQWLQWVNQTGRRWRWRVRRLCGGGRAWQQLQQRHLLRRGRRRLGIGRLHSAGHLRSCLGGLGSIKRGAGGWCVGKWAAERSPHLCFYTRGVQL